MRTNWPLLIEMRYFLKIREKVTRASQKSLVRGTLWLLASQGFKLIIQASFFILIARLLGSRDYGAFMAASALPALIAPFASLGTETLILRDVAKNRNLLAVSYGNALFMALAVGSLLVSCLYVMTDHLFPEGITAAVVGSVALSEIIFLKAIVICSNVYLSMDMYKRVAQINVLLSFKNLLACLALWLFLSDFSLENWAFIYSVSTGVLALCVLHVVWFEVSSPRLSIKKIFRDLSEGVYFSVDRSAYIIYNSIDKYMLASLSTLEAAGIYSAAYRFIDVAFFPISALMTASFSRFFRQGKSGIAQSLSFAKKIVPISVVYAVLAFVGVFLVSPYIPLVLGNDYAQVPEALRWLAPMILFRSVLYFGGDTLTGAGYQRIRTFAQIVFALLNTILNAFLIPQYSWLGATWATLLSELFLALSLWCIVFYINQKVRNRE